MKLHNSDVFLRVCWSMVMAHGQSGKQHEVNWSHLIQNLERNFKYVEHTKWTWVYTRGIGLIKEMSQMFIEKICQNHNFIGLFHPDFKS